MQRSLTCLPLSLLLLLRQSCSTVGMQDRHRTAVVRTSYMLSSICMYVRAWHACLLHQCRACMLHADHNLHHARPNIAFKASGVSNNKAVSMSQQDTHMSQESTKASPKKPRVPDTTGFASKSLGDRTKVRPSTPHNIQKYVYFAVRLYLNTCNCYVGHRRRSYSL